jgi:hypothetical protein
LPKKSDRLEAHPTNFGTFAEISLQGFQYVKEQTGGDNGTPRELYSETGKMPGLRGGHLSTVRGF